MFNRPKDNVFAWFFVVVLSGLVLYVGSAAITSPRSLFHGEISKVEIRSSSSTVEQPGPRRIPK
jgi:hypothetical protein